MRWFNSIAEDLAKKGEGWNKGLVRALGVEEADLRDLSDTDRWEAVNEVHSQAKVGLLSSSFFMRRFSSFGTPTPAE